MELNDAQYIASGGTFLLVAAFAIRILLNLESSTEQMYERRATGQVATIRDLEDHERKLRHEMNKCHEERLSLETKVSRLQHEVTSLRDELKQFKDKKR